MKKEDFYSQTKIVKEYNKRRFGGKGGLWVNKKELDTIKNFLPKSGKVLDAPDEKWSSIAAALISGRRGLPGGSSLTKLFKQYR